MATTEYDTWGQSCPATTSETLLYEVPTGKYFVASTVCVCNVATIASATDARYDIIVRPAGESTTASKNYVAKNVLLYPGEYHSLTVGYTIQDGGKILVVSSVANTLSFSLFGTLISEVVS